MIDRDITINNLEMNIRWIEDISAHRFPGWGNVTMAMRDAVELLKKQEVKEQTSDVIHESAKQFINKQIEWIDVTEKLPSESDGYVLVCMPNEFPYNQRQRVRLGQYSEYAHQWFFEGGAVGGSDPIAWKPLPEPIYDDYEKGFNDAMLGKQELMYEGEDGKWYKKDW